MHVDAPTIGRRERELLRDGARDRPNQPLRVRDHGFGAAERAIPLEQGELGLVERAGLVGAADARELELARDAPDDQPFHFELGGGDEPSRPARERLDVAIHAGARHGERRLDLEEARTREVTPDGGERPTARAQASTLPVEYEVCGLTVTARRGRFGLREQRGLRERLTGPEPAHDEQRAGLVRAELRPAHAQPREGVTQNERRGVGREHASCDVHAPRTRGAADEVGRRRAAQPPRNARVAKVAISLPIHGANSASATATTTRRGRCASVTS